MDQHRVCVSVGVQIGVMDWEYEYVDFTAPTKEEALSQAQAYLQSNANTKFTEETEN